MPFNIVKIYDTLHLTMRNCYNDKFNLYEKDYIGNMKKIFFEIAWNYKCTSLLILK